MGKPIAKTDIRASARITKCAGTPTVHQTSVPTRSDNLLPKSERRAASGNDITPIYGVVGRVHEGPLPYPGIGSKPPGPIARSDLSGEPLVWMLRRDSGDHHDPLMQACRQPGLEQVIGQWAGSSEEVMDLVTLSAELCGLFDAGGGAGAVRLPPAAEVDRELDLSLGWTEMEGLLGRAFLDRVHREIDRHQTLIRAGEEPWTQLDGLRLYRVAEPQTN